MVIRTVRKTLPFHNFLLRFSYIRLISSLEQKIKSAIEAKSYQKIPDLLISSKEQSTQNPNNPFSFLSDFSVNQRTQIVDEILQSFIPLRPRTYPKLAYSFLLSYTLQNPKPLPLALAILQSILRSGISPEPEIRVLLSSAWLEKRKLSHSVSSILMEMGSIGYSPDCCTCNYIIYCLCANDQLLEAINILKGMGNVGCFPNLESYGSVISSMCVARRTADAVELLKEMVVKIRLNPRQGTVVKLLATLRENREIWRAAEIIEFLEREGCAVGFEGYELVVEGCLECKEYILAGKVVMGMTEKGFIPYIKVRQKVVEGLAGAGEWKFACAVRQRFTELSS